MFENIQAWDERWSISINNRQFGRIISNVFVYFTHLGSVIPWIIVSIILFFWVHQEFGAILGSGIIQFGIIQFLLKRIIHRKRPYKNEKIKDQITLRDLMLRNGGQSFPSGHVATLTMVSLLFVYYFNNYYFLIFSVAGVIFVAYSRLYLGAHYPTDVISAVFFGVALLFILIASIPAIIWSLEQYNIIFPP